jgi:hypothetical protein
MIHATSVSRQLKTSNRGPLEVSQGEQKSQNDVKMMSKYGQILVCQNDIKLHKILMFS